jgi:GTP cyclohydrolase IA
MHQSDIDQKAIITNFPSPVKEQPLMKEEERIAYIAVRFKEIMEALGLDLTDKSLERTPERVARMYVKEIFSGLTPSTFPPISYIEDHYKSGGRPNMLFMKVFVTSFCEHHFVPMIGSAYVAYLPNKKLIGLSKIPRIVRFFARRPQVQERLNAQIADCLSHILETEDVAVSITCQHFCIAARGIEDQSGWCTTQVLRGKFDKDDSHRQEYFDAIQRIDAKEKM